MSKKPENTFIGGVHAHLPKNLHKEKMANPYRGGTADCWYSGKLADMWIEYKYIERVPAQADVVANCSALQLAWLRGRFDEGRSVFVVIGCPNGGVILKNLAWEMPIPAVDFRSLLVSRKEIARWILDTVGEPNDQIGRRNLQSVRGVAAKSRQRAADMC